MMYVMFVVCFEVYSFVRYLIGEVYEKNFGRGLVDNGDTRDSKFYS